MVRGAASVRVLEVLFAPFSIPPHNQCCSSFTSLTSSCHSTPVVLWSSKSDTGLQQLRLFVFCFYPVDSVVWPGNYDSHHGVLVGLAVFVMAPRWFPFGFDSGQVRL